MDGSIDFAGQLDHSEMTKAIAEYMNGEENFKVIVVEDYIVYGHKAKAHAGSKLVAARIIGQLETLASVLKIPLVKQPARVLSIASRLSGKTQPRNHAESHWVDAYNHGYYWLVKNGYAKTALEMRTQK